MTKLLPGRTPGFTGSPLDRADNLRDDEAEIARLRAHPDARLILLDGIDPVFDANHCLSWTPLSEAPRDADLAFLGLIDGTPHFAALASVPHAAGRSASLWQRIGFMPDSEASTYAAARSLIDWHHRHRFCANCGAATLPLRAGWARRCASCESQHFPRTDPVVIMLGEHEGRVLVGRQPSFPAGFYSALAGFVEVGESIEEAVARELFEEAGVRSGAVRYIASQPWPFPSSLMIACVAEVTEPTIRIDEKELEHAMWVDRATVAAALDGAQDAAFLAPPPYAVAHTLFRRWLDGD